MRYRLFAVIAFAVLASGVSTAASAWPDRSIKIIVPFVAGGSSDTLARILAEGLRDKLGQTVLVENRAGGNGVIGMTAVAGAASDGYTLLAGHIGTHAITPAITPPVGYDPAKTFVTVAVPATSANVMVVRADSKIDSLDDLIRAAKSKPFALNYGSPGVGSPSHIAVVQLAALSGIEVTHIAYRGNAAAVTDMLNGTLDFMFSISETRTGYGRPARSCFNVLARSSLKVGGASFTLPFSRNAIRVSLSSHATISGRSGVNITGVKFNASRSGKA
jgi:tripartite-type tricarboxylate transporter receptor subunit TctC